MSVRSMHGCRRSGPLKPGTCYHISGCRLVTMNNPLISGGFLFPRFVAYPDLQLRCVEGVSLELGLFLGMSL